MYYVVGVRSGRVFIRDSKTMVTKPVSLNKLRSWSKAGVEIEGITKSETGDVNFGEFKVSPEIGRKNAEAKYALLTGVTFEFDKDFGDLLGIDISYCKNHCEILLDNICSCISEFNIDGRGGDVTVKIGPGVSLISNFEGYIAPKATGILDRVRIDISEASDAVFDKLAFALKEAGNFDRVYMGDRSELWRVECCIFHCVNNCYLPIVAGKKVRRDVLEDPRLNKRFLSRNKDRLIVRDFDSCVCHKTFYRYAEPLLKDLPRLTDYSYFLKIARSLEYVDFANKLMYTAKAGNLLLSWVWLYFYYGGDDLNIYESFLKALLALKVVG